MTNPGNSLVQAFLSDHKTFMRHLRQVAEALHSHDAAAARALARRLDTIAGPHIAFEEAVLYPVIDDATQERGFVQGLYAEHQTVVAALGELIESREMSASRMDDLHSAFVKGLEHANHCGTLISRLATMDECELSDAFDELRQLRAQNIKWTDLTKDN
jgi:hypothetical protein